MVTVDFNETEERILRFLADRFDGGGMYVYDSELRGELGLSEEDANRIVARFQRYGILTQDTTDSNEITDRVLEAVHQLDNPPQRDVLKEWRVWWFKSWWRTGITVATVLLPLIVQWIEMIIVILRWVGVL